MLYRRMMSLFLLLPLFIMVSHAQELCEALVREAFEAVTQNCGDLENANACYGFDSISATFYEVGEGTSFAQPSDSVNIANLQTVRTSPFDEEEEEWGISYFQIELPNSEEPLIIMSAGDVIVENDVAVADETGLALMQAFNFTTGGESDCREAPNAVYIQGPRDVEVNLLINSVPIRIASTVVLGTFNENGEDNMWLGVAEGHAVMYPDSENSVNLEEGMVSTSPLTNENGDSPNGTQVLNEQRVPVLDPITGEQVIGPDGEPFYRQVPYTEFEEPQEISTEGEGPFDWQTYEFIEAIPAELVNYSVNIPDEEDAAPTPEPTLEEPVVLPELEVTEAVVSSVSDPNLTECGTRNWCNEGEPWGDGRCNDPDPDVSNWYWNAGWYNAQLECGAISSIPEEFAPLPQADAADVGGLIVEVTNCNNLGTQIDFTIRASNIPSNANVIGVIADGGATYLNVLNPPSSPGPDSGTISVPSASAPLTGAFVGYSGVSGLSSVSLGGPHTC
jgi:hypothetical protein